MSTFNEINKERIDAIKSINIAYFLNFNFGYPHKKEGNSFIVQTPNYKINVFKSRYNSNVWLFKIHNQDSSGSLIDYLSKHENYGFPNSPIVLERIYKEVCLFDKSMVTYTQPNLVSHKVAQLKPDLSLQSFENFQYLSSRGLDSAIIRSPKYQNTIFNKILFSTSANNLSFNNIAFPYVNEAGKIVDVAMRNRSVNEEGKYQSFNGYVSGGAKSTGIWHSSTNEKLIGTIQNFVIGESEIDLISFTQLNPTFSKNTLDISIGGGLSNGQISVIQSLVHKFQPQKIYLINDADKAGCLFDFNLMSILRNVTIAQIPTINFSFSLLSDKDVAEMKLPISNVNYHQKLSFTFFDNKNGLLYKLMNDFTNYFPNNSGKVFLSSSFNEHTINIIAKYDLTITASILKIYAEIYSNLFQILKPIDITQIHSDDKFIPKDWNEILMHKHNIDKSFIHANYNPYFGVSRDEFKTKITDIANTFDKHDFFLKNSINKELSK